MNHKQIKALRHLVRARWVLAVLLMVSSAWSADTTDWHFYERDGLVLYLPHADTAQAESFLGELIVCRNEVRRKLGGTPPVPMMVYLAPSSAVFHDLTRDQLPHWSAGVAFPRSRMIVLKSGVDNLLQVARHEFAHVLLHALVPQGVPVWFNEGVAMWASHEWRLRQSAAVFSAVFSDDLIPLSEIDDVLAFSSVKADMAYAESLLAITFLIHLGGPNAVVAMLAELQAGAPFDVALYRVTGESPLGFEKRWREDVRGRFGIMTLLFSPDLGWIYLTFLVVLVYLGVKRRNRATLRRWEAEEAAEDLPLKFQLKVHRREDEP